MDNSARAKLYSGNKILFIGDGYFALHMFIKESGNDPKVINRFKNQLEMREKHKWKEVKTDGSDRSQSD